MLDAEGYTGIIGEQGTQPEKTRLSLGDMVKIYYRSFGEKAFTTKTDEDIERVLDGILPTETRAAEGAVEVPKGTIGDLDRKLGSFGEPKPWLAVCVLGIWKPAFLIAFLATIGVSVYLFIKASTPAAFASLAVAAAFYALRGLGAEIASRFLNLQPERYLNKAAHGVARILDVPNVIFGHTHVAYVKPIRRGSDSGPVKQWEVNTGSWTPVFDEQMILRQTGDEFPFVFLITENADNPSPELLMWNDSLGTPEKIRYTGK